MLNQTTSLEYSHFPVMLDEVIKIFSPNKEGIYLDCTFGGGGYSKKLLTFPKTKVVAVDRDKFVLNLAKDLKKKYPNRFNFYQKKFSEVNSILSDKKIDGAIFDLGLSSIQLNNLKRGFSFKSKQSLDMSMGLTDLSAEEVINEYSQQKLLLIIKILGEEKDAFRIVKNIIKARSICKITKVDQLVEIIEKSKKRNYKTKINPCTKTFQALRIFVNKEITELIKGMINVTNILKPGGKILVVSFHSIEDKIVKYFFTNFSSSRAKPSRYFPDYQENSATLFEAYKNKILKPSIKEINQNPPSRSAKFRYAIRNKNKFIYPEELEIKFKKYLELEGSHV